MIISITKNKSKAQRGRSQQFVLVNDVLPLIVQENDERDWGTFKIGITSHGIPDCAMFPRRSTHSIGSECSAGWIPREYIAVCGYHRAYCDKTLRTGQWWGFRPEYRGSSPYTTIYSFGIGLYSDLITYSITYT